MNAVKRKVSIMRGFLLLLFFTGCFYENLPKIYSIFPPRGPAGTQVTISGKNFGDINKDKVNLYFGGITTPRTNIISWTDCTIKAAVPSNAVTGRVVVEVNGLKSKEDISFEVLQFAPIEIPVFAVIGEEKGGVDFLRSDEKGFYLDGSLRKILKYKNKRASIIKTMVLKNYPETLVSGWIEEGENTQYLVFGWNDYLHAVSEPVEVDGAIVDAEYYNGSIYLLDYLGRGVDILDPEEWKITAKKSLIKDMPFAHPVRLFYSKNISSFVVITKPIFTSESGDILIYDDSFQLKQDISLPPFDLYDAFFYAAETSSESLVFTGWQTGVPMFIVFPDMDAEKSFSRIFGSDSGYLEAGGFALSPDFQGVIATDTEKGNILYASFSTGPTSYLIDESYGMSITDPSMVKTIPDFDYVFTLSGGKSIVMVDTTINAIYGNFYFIYPVVDFDVGVEK